MWNWADIEKKAVILWLKKTKKTKKAQDYVENINDCWNWKFLWRCHEKLPLTTDKECHRKRFSIANDGGEPFRMPTDWIGIWFLQSYGIRRQHMVPSSHHWVLWRFHHFLHILQREPASLTNRMLSHFHCLCGNKCRGRNRSHTAWLCSHGQGCLRQGVLLRTIDVVAGIRCPDY